MNQPEIFLSGGGNTVRYLSAQAERVLEWFHVTLRLTALRQIARGLPEPLARVSREEILHVRERLKWFFWHDNLYLTLPLTTCQPGAPRSRITTRHTLGSLDGGYVRITSGSRRTDSERTQRGWL